MTSSTSPLSEMFRALPRSYAAATIASNKAFSPDLCGVARLILRVEWAGKGYDGCGCEITMMAAMIPNACEHDGGTHGRR